MVFDSQKQLGPSSTMQQNIVVSGSLCSHLKGGTHTPEVINSFENMNCFLKVPVSNDYRGGLWVLHTTFKCDESEPQCCRMHTEW